MKLLWLRGVFFALMNPGIVGFVIPYFLTRNQSWQPNTSILLFGLAIVTMGTVALLACIFQFGTQGKGTLSPLDPTRRLVTTGIYRFTRNPMYVSVATILIGECFITATRGMLTYTLIVCIAFHVFVVFREEPRLTRAFGDEYLSYSKRVRRWI